MDLGRGDPERAQAGDDGVDHLPRPADEDVPIPEVGDGGGQEARSERLRVHLLSPPSDDVVDDAPASRDQLVQLLLEDDVLPGGARYSRAIEFLRCGISSMRARSGVMPIPPAMSSAAAACAGWR